MLERSIIVNTSTDNFQLTIMPVSCNDTGMEVKANSDMPELHPEKSGRVRSGIARMGKLTPEERSALARRAAERRWAAPATEDLPYAIKEGTLTVGDIKFDCAVLNDETRVITEADFMKTMGMYRSGALSVRRREREASAPIPLFLAHKNIKPFADKHLGSVHFTPKRYRTTKGGVAAGIPALAIPKVCEIWIDANRAGVLGRTQERIAEKADTLLRGFAYVGIIALVDEATGYQRDRADEALQAILQQYLRSKLAVWVKTFPDEYYKEIYRLRGWPWYGMSKNRYSVVGKYTIDLVYRRLTPGLLKELEKRNPKINGRRRDRYPQWLTEDIGNPALKQHLFALIALMRSSDSWNEFYDRANRAFVRYGDTLQLPFGPTPMEIEAADKEGPQLPTQRPNAFEPLS